MFRESLHPVLAVAAEELLAAGELGEVTAGTAEQLRAEAERVAALMGQIEARPEAGG